MCESPKEKEIRYEWMGNFIRAILKKGADVFYPSDVRHLEPERPTEFRMWWHRHMFLYLIKTCGVEKNSGFPRKSKALSRDGAPELNFYIKPFRCRNDKKSTKQELIKAFLNIDEDNGQQCMTL